MSAQEKTGMEKRPVILVLGPSALPLALKIRKMVPGAQIHARADRVRQKEGIDHHFDNAMDHIRALFAEERPIIGICAAAILIRAVAPCLTDKHVEPALLAIDEKGACVVPLIGGHHGANALARAIADGLGATAAITTAGDAALGIALDETPPGWTLANPLDAKKITADLLSGATVLIDDRLDWIDRSQLKEDKNAGLRLTYSDKHRAAEPGELLYYRQTHILGIGAERGVPAENLIPLVDRLLQENNIPPESIACVASVDLKADETALHDLSSYLGRPARFFTVEDLNKETPRLKNPSEVVMREIGCPGVAEAAALAAAGSNAELIIEKTKGERVTVALAKSDQLIETSSVGRARGTLSIVGIGPGTKHWRAPEAERLLRDATDWVGYGFYLDLVDDLERDQVQHRYDLGAEINRVRAALEIAGEGKDVALVCSGDAGIYAMAALAYELLDEEGPHEPLTNAAKRVALTVVPGISAFQAAAARAGAPIGHDFCCISLSDLLTPWEMIERRIKTAAEGDFVISFYNPRSLRRTDKLDKAVEILSQHRPADTPVIIARSLGRPDEEVSTVRLCQFDSSVVDMMTLVMVGASNSRQIKTGDGNRWVYTPRGYAKKSLRAILNKTESF